MVASFNIFRQMQIRVRGCTLLAAAVVALATATAAYGAKRPTPAQVHARIRAAMTSRDLWATVNICNSRRYPNVIGIRAQMPGLGFATKLEMAISIQYWSFAKNAFVPLPGSTRALDLGSPSTGLHQGGVTFQFMPHAGYLRGTVTFTWTSGRKQLASATRTTSQGHRNADYGDPAGYSAWECVIS